MHLSNTPLDIAAKPLSMGCLLVKGVSNRGTAWLSENLYWLRECCITSEYEREGAYVFHQRIFYEVFDQVAFWHRLNVEGVYPSMLLTAAMLSHPEAGESNRE